MNTSEKVLVVPEKLPVLSVYLQVLQSTLVAQMGLQVVTILEAVAVKILIQYLQKKEDNF